MIYTVTLNPSLDYIVTVPGFTMGAGFLAGWQKSRDPSYAFRMAVAAGSASAFSDHLAEAEEIGKLMGEIKVKEISGFIY